MTLKNLTFLCISLFLVSCAAEPEGENTASETNPPAPGFNLTNSDPEAIALADSVMAASGGRQQWDNTRYIKWNFFGSRVLLWDKLDQRVRIESQRNDLRIIVYLQSDDGQVFKDGKILTDRDSLRHYLDMGKRMWINDSYWLAMPFKMKDSGVTLKYLGEDVSDKGIESELVELTFDNVGVTPQNKYRVWIGKQSNLVVQWAYYRSADDSEPRMVTPWEDYIKYGDLYFSVTRGNNRQLSGIEIFDEVDPSNFTDVDRQML